LRISLYYDDPIKVGVWFTLFRAIVGMFIGVWAAAQLAWPSLNIDTAWASFGRIRPAHTTGVIFGFGGNALIATSFHERSVDATWRRVGEVLKAFTPHEYAAYLRHA
jgi:cytochrome c oxidase cbb3-type subunit I